MDKVRKDVPGGGRRVGQVGTNRSDPMRLKSSNAEPLGPSGNRMLGEPTVQVNRCP